MKRIIAMISIILLIAVSLIGCRGDVVNVTVVIKNDTDYELKRVIFDIPQSSGSYSPLHDVITVEKPLKPGETQEIVISLVDTDFGNSGGSLIDLTDGNDSSTLQPAKGEVVLERGSNNFKITHKDETFFITAGDSTSD